MSTNPQPPGPRIAWLITDEYGKVTLVHERPDYYSGVLKQIIYWEVQS